MAEYEQLQSAALSETNAEGRNFCLESEDKHLSCFPLKVIDSLFIPELSLSLGNP